MKNAAAIILFAGVAAIPLISCNRANSSGNPAINFPRSYSFISKDGINKIRDAYKTNILIIPSLKDPAGLRYYYDVETFLSPKLAKKGYLYFGVSGWSNFARNLRQHIELDNSNFISWYVANEDYIYWDDPSSKFRVDLDAKSKGTPINPLTQKPMSLSEKEEMKILELEFEFLKLKSYDDVLNEIKDLQS